MSDKRQKFLYRLIVIAIIVGLIGSVLLIINDNFILSTQNRDINQKNNLKDILIKIQAEDQYFFVSLENDLAKIAVSLQSKGLDGRFAKEELENLTKKYPMVEDAFSISHDGVIQISAKDKYRSFEGISVKNESFINETFNHQVPMMSRVSGTFFSTPAVSVVEPVFSQKGEYIGLICAIINPFEFISNITAPAIKDTPYRVRVIEDSGALLFDSQENAKEENLNNISQLKDRELSGLDDEVLKSDYGMGIFTSGNASSGKVIHKAFWTTTGLKEAKWRIIIS